MPMEDDFREIASNRTTPVEGLREQSSDITVSGTTEIPPGEKALEVYDDEALFGPGLQQEWQSLAGGEPSRETFQSAYETYVTDPTTLSREAPEQYRFLKEHIFYGVEYQEALTLSEQVKEGVEALAPMGELRPGAWENIGVDERAAALQEAEARLAERAGRPAVTVIVEKTDPGVNGYYDPQTGTMHLSEHLVQDAGSLARAIDTVAHEGRHAYQHHAINNPGFHPDAAQVRAWAENLQPGNYLTAELYGYEAYRNQPIEADAWAFGEAIRDGLYGGQGT